MPHYDEHTALITGHQMPLIEKDGHVWRIWISYDKTRTAGTYLTLYPSGRISRDTRLPTGEVVNSITVKP